MFIILVVSLGCNEVDNSIVYQSESLTIKKLTHSTWIHISLLELRSGNSFPCNGLVYADSGESIIFDTPTNNRASLELIKFVQDSLKTRIKGVVVNHFHVDCLGGLDEFHNAGIDSYSSNATIELAKRDSLAVPIIGFDQEQMIIVGKNRVFNKYPGPGHTLDNIVSYIPSDKVLFGGCLVKSVGASKGNLADASVSEWANSIQNIKAAFPKIVCVVPGHGEPGDVSLLEYTIGLFSND